MNDWKAERREYTRTEVTCPTIVSGETGRRRIRGKALNISDGGAMLTIPMDALTGMAPNVQLTISVPRVTPNTKMLEKVATEATVVRHEPMTDVNLAGIAVRFSAPLDLQLEV